MDVLPDFSSLSDDELRRLIDEHVAEEEGSPTGAGCCTAVSTSCAPSWSTASSGATAARTRSSPSTSSA